MELFRMYFPYGMEKQPDGSWVLFNRHYKPVGFNTPDHIDYGAYPVSFDSRLVPSTKAKLSWTGEDTGDRVFFYNDGCYPTASGANMKAYLGKMRLLMKLRLKYDDRDA